MPPRKTQTIKEVVKESQPIIEQKLGSTRSKKVKKNEIEDDSALINTQSQSKQKNTNASSKAKSSTNQSKDQPQEQLSPELKPSSQSQKVRTKAQKVQDKLNARTEEVKMKQQNQDENQDKQKNNNQESIKEQEQKINQQKEENKEIDADKQQINDKDKSSNLKIDYVNNEDQELSKVDNQSKQDKATNLIDNEQKEFNEGNKVEQVDQENNLTQNTQNKLNTQDEFEKDNNTNIKQYEQKKSDQKDIPQIIVRAPESELDKIDQKNSCQGDEEEKEQFEQKQKVIQSLKNSDINDNINIVDVVFCCDINLVNIEQLKNAIEFLTQNLKIREKSIPNIQFSIVCYNDIITSQQLQQLQFIDLRSDAEILSNLDEIKDMKQIELKKGLCYGLKLATTVTKWRPINNNNKCYRYIIHITNQQLKSENQSEEFERIVQEMNDKGVRYKYLRIDKKIDLDLDNKQYFQNKLNSYEESCLKEFGCIKNVVSSIILREMLHENNK